MCYFLKIFVKNTDNDNFKTYSIKSTSELSNEWWQHELKKRHKQQRSIKCQCDVWLSIVNQNNKYFLRSYPKSPKTHRDECLFQNNGDYEADGSFNMRIFAERKFDENTNNEQEFNKSDCKTHNTFYDFCVGVLKNAQAFAFNSQNKGLEVFSNNLTPSKMLSIINITQTNVTQAPSVDILISKLKDKQIYFSYGITEQTIDDFYNSNTFEINIKGKIIKLIFENKKIEYVTKRLKIFDNFIKPPYFYFLTSSYGKVVRLFLYPVSIYNNVITFVESEKERIVAKKFIDNNYVFFKPISDEFVQLASKPNRPYLKPLYRPDFFVYNKNSCTIVEVSGKMGEDYEKLLLEKEKYYKSFKDFQYKRIE